MKKNFILSFLLLTSTLTVSAQMKEVYAYTIADDGGCKSFVTKYMIDRGAKKFRFDSDSEDDAKMLMKNYKKTGNKETFDIYPEMNPGTKLFSVELVVDPEQKTNPNPKHQTLIFKKDGKVTERYALKTEEQSNFGRNSGKVVKKTNAAQEDANPKEKISDGAKRMLKKGLGVFKKK